MNEPKDVRALGAAVVLVVDDHPPNLELARCVLTSHGYEVETADGGEEALLKISSRKPDLVLLDIQMPVLDGMEVVRRLRLDPVTRSLRLIAFTAYAMAGDEQRFIDAGFDGYLAKPIDVRSFGAQLQNFFRPGEA